MLPTPGGALRFNAPQPHTGSALYPALEDAQAQLPQCRQAGLALVAPTEKAVKSTCHHGLPESEDGLFLNVYVPGQIDASKRLPVIVWIHGGGFVIGSIQSVAAFSSYNGDGDDLIYGMRQVEVEEDGAVVAPRNVWVPRGKEVKEDGALNAGLLDQQLALQLVQERILCLIFLVFGKLNRLLLEDRQIQRRPGPSVLEHVIANNARRPNLVMVIPPQGQDLKNSRSIIADKDASVYPSHRSGSCYASSILSVQWTITYLADVDAVAAFSLAPSLPCTSILDLNDDCYAMTLYGVTYGTVRREFMMLVFSTVIASLRAKDSDYVAEKERLEGFVGGAFIDKARVIGVLY
ncbi:alpha/beta-hydrolase [Hymenopellis radicata]|nr:alpha/beta-hydrolase [Hymenopellis radicata]